MPSNKVIEPWPGCALSSTRKTARLLTQLYDSYLSEYGVEAAQYALMVTLESAADKGQAAMGRALGIDKTTLSRNLKILREKGWVKSIPGKDARQRIIVLTAEGRERLVAAKPAWRRAQEEFRAGLSDNQWNGMWSSLRVMTRAAGKAIEHKQSSGSDEE